MTSRTQGPEPSAKDLDLALRIAGGLAIVGGVAAAVVFGPAVVGGAVAGAGAKLVAIGGRILKKDLAAGVKQRV